MTQNWMIYGANGYTGRLIVEKAKERKLAPILAGRNEEKIKKLADQFELEYRIFDLTHANVIRDNLSGIEAVLHCAGPFSATHAPLFQGCLNSKTHYLDITGEISVFRSVHERLAEIKKADVVAIPGVGFDIVPTDCMAAMLKKELPDADHLKLGLKTYAGISPGTLKTVIENISGGGLIRKDGVLTEVGTAYRVENIKFGRESESAVTVPWADVLTAYYSTDIPNIEVYLALNSKKIELLKSLNSIKWLFFAKPVQHFFQGIVDQFVKGDSLEKIEKGKALIWGEVRNSSGGKVQKLIRTGHPYLLTAESAIKSIEKVLSGKISPGAWTPSQAFGAEFLSELETVQVG